MNSSGYICDLFGKLNFSDLNWIKDKGILCT